jgi:hypothetical protein
MGYTHYWYRIPELDAERFAKAVADCEKIWRGLPVPLGDGHGEGEPMFASDAVCFNGHKDSQGFARLDEGAFNIPWPHRGGTGIGGLATTAESGETWFAGKLLNTRAVDSSGDGSYETFDIGQVEENPEYRKGEKMVFACCKTAFRPYDLNVQCCLIVFAHYFGPAEFIVSSDGDQDLWSDACAACQDILGYGLDFDLEAHCKLSETA